MECVILRFMQHTSIYYHIPFCRKRCGYCDFNTFAGLSRFIPAYVDAICQEIEIVGSLQKTAETVHTCFFGGGTPSLLKVEQVSQIITATRRSFEVCQGAEITLEANPGTVTRESVEGYVASGVNRFSFGMQSASPDDLRILDRTHSFEQVVDAVKFCKMSGIEHINLDLIFGIPGQSMERWRTTLERAVETGIDHLSVYGLTIEEGTPMYRWVEKGALAAPDDDQAADMYEAASEFLLKQGFEQYEISNWARGESAQCKHNLQYWRYQPYYGFGAGAHGFVNGVRTENVALVPEYLQRMKEHRSAVYPASPAVKEVNNLSWWDQAQEMMMVGLRMTQSGVSMRDFRSRFGIEIGDAFEGQVRRLKEEGLVELVETPEKALRLTRKGRLLGNRVFLEFVGNEEPEHLTQVTRRTPARKYHNRPYSSH